MIESQAALIKGLRTGIEELTVLETGKEIKNEIRIPIGNDLEIYLIGAIDKDKEQSRITKEIENLEKLTNNLGAKLGNQEFVANAPAKIVAAEQEKLKNWQSELEKLKEQVENLK